MLHGALNPFRGKIMLNYMHRRAGSLWQTQSLDSEPPCKTVTYYHIIIGFLINVQVQGQHPHQWAPFQIAGLLHAWQISHQISRYVYHEGR